MKHLILFTALICAGCMPRFYVQGGVSAHDTHLAAPEVRFGDPVLGHAEAGLEAAGWTVYARHTTAVVINEHGAGINEVGIYKRIYLGSSNDVEEQE